MPKLIGVKFAFKGSHFLQLKNALQMSPEVAFFEVENLLVRAMQTGAARSYSPVVCMNPQSMLRMYALADAGRCDEVLAMQSHLVRFFRGREGLLDEMGAVGADPVCDKGMSVASEFFVDHQRTRPLKFTLTIMLDFSLREKLIPPVALSYLETAFPTTPFPQVCHLQPEEMLAEKLRAILSRCHGRDIFDLWFLLSKKVSLDWILVN